ncbi:MAG: 50S ribosomal protein L25, partial [Bacteroidaceae bacterium]|nr:50S ribosomal protein L25 [Bacteroidaceae bacterium]
MKSIDVKGTARNEFGKKGAKALRKQNLIPCNLYGVERNEKGLPVAKAFSVTFEEVRKLVYSPDIFSVNLTIDGNTVLAVMREIQFHPVKDNILHIDFYQVTPEKPIVMAVPVKLNGLAAGVKAGGKLEQILRRVKAKALYTAIPEKIEIDVTPLTIGKSFKAGDLKVDGIEFTSPKDAVICTVL